MREVLIDVTRLVDRQLQGRLPTGVDRVSLEYVRHFGGRSTALVRFAGQWIDLPHGVSENVFGALLSPSQDFKRLIHWGVAKAFPGSFRRRPTAPRLLFNTGHSGLENPRYARHLQGSGLKPLYFVHDLIPMTHPEYGRPGEYARHQKRMDTVLATACGVIANSTATLDDLTAYAYAQARPMPPAEVALLAPATFPFLAKAAPPLHKPYFVVLGTIEPRKNHWLLLHLWRQLIERFGEAAPRLVIIGQRGWECENVVDLLERCASLKDFVVELPTCSDDELAWWLAHARALLFPSFAEGYGMPLVEALSIGLPVIASTLPAFREIATDIPEYVDPLDGKRWSELVVDYASPESRLRQAQLVRLEGFIAPCWDAHFARVEALIARACSAAC